MGKSDKRDDILCSAMHLMAEEGFDGAPMAQIATRAGVAAGTIYRYFKSRVDLIICIHEMIHEEFIAYLSENPSSGKPVKESFFHLAKAIIDFHITDAVKFKYSEQFFHSPYGMNFRMARLINTPDEGDLFHDIYENGVKTRVIKNIPKVLFSNLAFAPIFWCLKDHHGGLITIDETLAETIVSACWDSIKA